MSSQERAGGNHEHVVIELSCSRAEAVEFGIAANESEGLEVSPLFKELAEEYVRGEIGLREFHDRLDLHYCGRRGVSNALSGCRY